MRVKSDDLKGKYPPTACNAAKDSFLGHPRNTGELLAAGLSNWEKQAVNEYTANMELQKHGKKTDYGTTMQCFCRYQKDEKTPFDGEFSGSKVDGKPVKAKICAYFFSDKDTSKAMGLTIAIFIVVINLILQKVIIGFVEWIGEDTHSQQLETITNLVFIA